MIFATGGERAEQIEQVVRVRCRRPVDAATPGDRNRSETGTARRAGEAHGPAVSCAEQGAQELGPGTAQVVPGEREGAQLPETVADELRADVQEDSGVRGANREPHRPDERVLGPLRSGRQEHGQENGEDRERHQTLSTTKKTYEWADRGSFFTIFYFMIIQGV